MTKHYLFYLITGLFSLGSCGSSSGSSTLAGDTGSEAERSATDSQTELGVDTQFDSVSETETAPADTGSGDSGAPVDTETDDGICTDPYLCSSFTADDPVMGETKSTGSVTTYGSPDDPEFSVGGACNYGATGLQYYAAIHVHVSASDSDYLGPWQDGHACGGCYRVRTRTADGWQDTFVRITDRCADQYCGVDLGGAPAADVMPLGPGRYEGEWWEESCEGHSEVFDGPTSLYVKDGSNSFWALVQVRNPLSRVTGLYYQKGIDPVPSGYMPMDWAVEAENFYKVPAEILQDEGTYTLRIDYAFSASQTVVVKGSDLSAAETTISL